jgi:large subunit ribosomal protein L25
MASVKQLAAQRRERVGKGAARAVRRENRVPAVIYGSGQAPVSISLDYKETNTLIYAGKFLTTVFEITVDGEKIRAIPRDYQLDVVKDTPMHVDFQRLSAGTRIRVQVPVHFINQETAPGIKRGGALNVVRHSVEMMVPADNIPDSITGDLAGLDINDSLHISAFKLPEGCQPTIRDRDFTVATIAPPSGYGEAAAAAPAAEPAKAATPAKAAAPKK